MVSTNHWLRGIKTYRLSWYLTRVSANHASSNWAQTVKFIKGMYHYLKDTFYASPSNFFKIANSFGVIIFFQDFASSLISFVDFILLNCKIN